MSGNFLPVYLALVCYSFGVKFYHAAQSLLAYGFFYHVVTWRSRFFAELLYARVFLLLCYPF